jgi:hypothetical protein
VAEKNMRLGYVVEGVIIAAVGARFISKTKIITSTDVINFIKLINKAPSKGNQTSILKVVKSLSPNLNPAMIDLIETEVGLAKIYYEYLVDPKNLPILQPYITGAISFANSGVVREWADMFYKNNQENRIIIRGTGISGQAGATKTKADLKVFAGLRANNKLAEININLSIKSNNTAQFGQVSGSLFENQQDLFKSVLQVDIASIKADYNKLAAKSEIDKAITLAYKTAASKFNNMNISKKIEDISKSLEYHSTLGESNLITVSLSKTGSSTYSPSVVSQKLKEMNPKTINAEVTMDATGKQPRLKVFVEKDYIVQIRKGSTSKSDGSRYVRNYIEGGKLFFDLIRKDYK